MSFWETLSEIVRVLLIMSATGGIVTIFLYALRPIVKKHLPKNTQYYLWVLALVAFLVPFSTFVSVPFATPMTPVQNIIEANVKSTAEWQNQIAMELYGVPYTQLDDFEQVSISYGEFEARNIFNYNFLLPYILLLGIAGFSKEIVQYNIYSFKLRRNRLPAQKDELMLLPDKAPMLFRNSLTPTPMLVGLFRPVIYLPDREYSEKQLQNIIFHELAHWRRHDVVIKWVSTITVCMHWFNPLAYFLRREIDRACELSCDELVIKNFDDCEKQSYGDTLIDMASDIKKSRVLVSTTMCEEKKPLKERLSAIMHSKKPTKKVIVFSCVLLAVAICGIIVLGSSANQTGAVDALFRQYGNEGDVIKPQSIITEVDAGDGSTVVFYYNANNNLACAIAEQGIFGYTIVKTGAELTIEFDTPASVMSGQYNNEKKWLAWGILRDSEITKAIVYGQEATIVEADNLRLFYVICDGEIPENDYHAFYNSADEPVWEIGSISPNELSDFKGVELYIWKDELDETYFTLLSGTNRNKTEEEIYDKTVATKNIGEVGNALSELNDELYIFIAQMDEGYFTKDEMVAFEQKVISYIDGKIKNYHISIGLF